MSDEERPLDPAASAAAAVAVGATPPRRPTAAVPEGSQSPWRARARVLGERGLYGATGVTAVLPLAALVAMLTVLAVKAIPAIRYNGWHIFTGSAWNPGDAYAALSKAGGVLHPVGADYGAWPFIAGTIISSAIAIVIGFPVAVGAAVMLVEKLPRRIAAVIGLCLEILAGIPSAVIGLWGVFILGPWLAKNIYPILHHLPNVPVFDIFRGDIPATGQGLLTAGIVLAAMIIPIIAATTRDLLRQVPETTKEGAEALGMTSTETFFTVQARWVRTGVIGAAVLGLGAALGETIAVAMISGAIPYLPLNIYSGFSTIAAEIATQLEGAFTDPSGLEIRSIAEIALILFVITLAANVIARLIVKRAARGAALPVGAGF